MRKKLISILLLCSLLTTILCGCTEKEVKNDGKPIVYASFYPINDLVKQIAGDTVELKTFMHLDKDPHLWEPTPKDMKELAKADLLIVNGANLEKWLDQVRENLPNLEIIVLSDSVDLITYKGAAAIGDFQYMCEYNFKTDKKYRIDFGHTHEDIMRVTFINNNDDLNQKKLIGKGKKLWNKKEV